MDDEYLGDDDVELTAEQVVMIQEMIMTGATNAEIMAAMPGITVENIVYAAAEAARANN
jgi:uncharacterized protein (DUF433 family)